MDGGIGRLERVGLRQAWPREREDFAPWLARPDTLALLGAATGLRLFGGRREEPVGRCRADIFCLDAETAGRVAIEAQLGPSDHTHLGQVLVYASGLPASAVIWVAARFRDQHRAALDWLNRGGGTRFFAVEIEAWRIGGSDPAPRFTVVARPGGAPPRPPLRARPVRGAIGRPARPPG